MELSYYKKIIIQTILIENSLERELNQMPGFFGFMSNHREVLEKEITLRDIIGENSQLMEDETVIQTSGWYGRFFRNAVKKFENDRLFYQDYRHFFIIDGVILNKQDLFEKYSITEKNMVALVKQMQALNSKSFFNEFRGTFAGMNLDKNTNEFQLYTNHIGDKDIFYYENKYTHTLYFGTDFDVLIELIQKHSNKKFDVNANAAYSVMTHGHTLCNETLFEDVHRLTPGHYLTYLNNELSKTCYYELKNRTVEITEEEAVNHLDSYFRKAIERAFEKDKEYGYKHLVALSGGLDSRMTAWVANEMGYTNTLNYTFSQTDYLDEKVPKKIANVLKNEWIFKSLDNGVYLYEYFEESIKITGARSQSSTVAHTFGMLNDLKLDKFGLVHTGQLGDVIIGTYYTEGKKNVFHPGDGAGSTKLLHKVQYSKENAFQVEDQEIFKFYNRGFTGVNTGLKPMYQYTETISPFQDIDLFDFCLSLPLKYRSGHYLYIKWINQCYPEAADFIYEKVNGKINRKVITVKGVPIPWTSIPSAVMKIVKKKLNLKLNSKHHMNPLDFWYKTNDQLSGFYESQFSKNISLVENTDLKKDCEYLFRAGTVLEKDQVITFLGFLNNMKNCMK